MSTLPGKAESGGRKGALWAGVVMVGLLLGGVGALQGVQSYMQVVLDKPPALLRKPLVEVSRYVGAYRAEGLDEKLPPEQVSVLGTNDYLLRTYWDTRKSDRDVGRAVKLNVNFYAKGNATPHVPDVCWTGSGMKVHDKTYFEVNGAAGQKMRMRLLSFENNRPQQESEMMLASGATAKTVNVAYVFQVSGGEYVATGGEVSRHYWDPKAKYAYHTKIEIMVPQPCTPEDARKVIGEFLTAVLPEIEKCLPEGKMNADTEQQLTTDNGQRTTDK